MRAGDERAKTVLRLIRTGIKNAETAKGAKGPELMAKLTRDSNPSQADQILKYVFGNENPPADAAPARCKP